MELSEPTPVAMKLLDEELSRRQTRNPGYSLRALARDLGVSHSLLSLARNGKRSLSRKTLVRVGKLLALDAKQTKNLLAGEDASLKSPRATAESNAEFGRISLDAFSVISDWQSYAILSLLELPDAKFQSKWISDQLGIPEAQARTMMDRLVRHGFVACKRGRWRQRPRPIKVENKLSTAITKQFHRQLLAKAAESLEKDPPESRNFSSITFPMDSSLLPYAIVRIRDFRRELTKELEEMAKPTKVYNLTVQLYPVSKGKKNA